MILWGALLIIILWTVTMVTGARLIFPRRSVGQRSPMSFLASLFTALTFTFNFAPLYVAADRILGGFNLVALIQHTCFVLATFFVMQLLLRSVGALTRPTNAIVIGVLTVAVATQTASFMLITRTPTTTDLMLVAHREPAAFVFSMAHFLFFSLACVIALRVGVMLMGSHAGVAASVSAGAMFVAGAAGIADVIVTVARDRSRLNGDMSFEWIDPVFRALILTVAFAFCIGLSVPAIAGAARRYRIARVLGILEQALARSEYKGWEPVTTVEDRTEPPAAFDALAALNETVIHLRDGQIFEKGAELTPAEVAALASAERILQGR